MADEEDGLYLGQVLVDVVDEEVQEAYRSFVDLGDRLPLPWDVQEGVVRRRRGNLREVLA